jgi:cardiolipin synthase
MKPARPGGVGDPYTRPMARRGEDRVLTVPNAVTLVRFFCLPIFVALLASAHHRGWAAAAFLLAALGLTDGVDGYIARHFHQVSNLGKVMDPVADRALFAVAGIGILVAGAVPWWVGVIVLAREALVAGATIGLALAGAKRIDVQWAGKAATFGLMFAFPLFLAGHSSLSWHHWAEDLAWPGAIWGMVFGWYSVATYVPLGRKALAEGRAERAQAPSPAVRA